MTGFRNVSPIGILPPERHEEIWTVQPPLNFLLSAYGFDRSEALAVHLDDSVTSA